MVGMDPRHSQDAIAQELMAKATELWGQKRAEESREVLEQAAEYLWLIAQNLPDREQEPAFFL